MKIFVIPDATADVTALDRCALASAISPEVRVCLLPPGKDPDDLTAEQLAEVKAASLDVVTEWTLLLGALKAGTREWNEAIAGLKVVVAGWQGTHWHAALRQALHLSEAEFSGWLKEIGAAGASGTQKEGCQASGYRTVRNGTDSPKPDSPKPSLTTPAGMPPSNGAKRGVITNFRTEYRYVPNKKGRAARASEDAGIRKDLAELKALDFKRLAAGFNETERAEVKAYYAAGKPPALRDRVKEIFERHRQGRRCYRQEDQSRLDELVKAYDCEIKQRVIAKTMDELREDIWRTLSGWPQRVRLGFPFVDDGSGNVRRIMSARDLKGLLQEYAVVKFNGAQDDEGTNFVDFEGLYATFCSSPLVPLWDAFEEYPFEPPIPGIYCLWHDDPDYEADGRYYVEFLKMFDNVHDNVSKAIFAAAVLTPFWGGPFGARPCFVHTADKPGSGKSTPAFKVGRLAGKALMINLDRRAEERLKERWLSDEGLKKRVGVIDNAKKTVDSELIEEIITAEEVSGKVLGVGEGSRPNILTHFLTANEATVSSDLARRCFFIQFDYPKVNPGWQEKLNNFVETNAKRIAMDCLYVLRLKPVAFDWSKIVDRETFVPWITDVLCRALAFQPVVEVAGGIAPEAVISGNQLTRVKSDQDLEDALTFGEGTLERICAWKGYAWTPASNNVPKEPVFVRTEPMPDDFKEKYCRAELDALANTMMPGDAAERIAEARGLKEFERDKKNNLCTYYLGVRNAKEVNAKWLVPWIDKHAAAGRLSWMWKGKNRARGFQNGWRGYYISEKAILEYLVQIWLQEQNHGMEITSEHVRKYLAASSCASDA